jgi:hypothetical protein
MATAEEKKEKSDATDEFATSFRRMLEDIEADTGAVLTDEDVRFRLDSRWKREGDRVWCDPHTRKRFYKHCVGGLRVSSHCWTAVGTRWVVIRNVGVFHVFRTRHEDTTIPTIYEYELRQREKT